MFPPETEEARWFRHEVQPHELDLRAYLQSRFPGLGEPDDIVQETYVRALREQHAGRIRHTRAFLFTAARNAALDFFRRRRNIGLDQVTPAELASLWEDEPPVTEVVSRRQEREVLAAAVQRLPARCRQVIMLRYLKGWSYKEISVALGIGVETVKTHMARGVRRCADHFVAAGLVRERQRN